MIRKQDRVSTVLRQDPALVDVFVAISPAFERLRRPALRKVMSRLVTVEQAARMGGVDADELVTRLNAASAGLPAGAAAAGRSDSAPAPDDGEADGTPSVAVPAQEPAAAAMPADLAGVLPEHVVELDVREDLRQGREPFSRIMAARREVPPGGVLCLRAIFEPVPLYAVMEKQGFDHWTEQLGPEDWRVWFRQKVEPAPAASAAAAPRAAAPSSALATAARSSEPEAPPAAASEVAGEDAGAGDVVVLDVRGLEPPEPMVRTLSALETMPPDATLVQLNVRVPQFLLPLLEERGFTYEIREQAEDLVRVFIRRA